MEGEVEEDNTVVVEAGGEGNIAEGVTIAGSIQVEEDIAY